MKIVMRTFAVLGWLLWSLGYYDPHGRFTLSVQVGHFERLVECERARLQVEGDGWIVLPRCVPSDEGAIVVPPVGPITR
jgi:hypothetical protein